MVAFIYDIVQQERLVCSTTSIQDHKKVILYQAGQS
jgi:hypothetical protein